MFLDIRAKGVVTFQVEKSAPFFKEKNDTFS
jgi:hypothetical protein